MFPMDYKEGVGSEENRGLEHSQVGQPDPKNKVLRNPEHLGTNVTSHVETFPCCEILLHVQNY